MNIQADALLQALHSCADACDQCFHACLQEEDPKMMARCIQLDRSCAEICRLMTSLVMSDEELHPPFLNACAEACRICGAECAKHEYAHCQYCADACRRCEEMCRQAA